MVLWGYFITTIWFGAMGLRKCDFCYLSASIVSGEPRIDVESLELHFFDKEEIPELFAEDHLTALDTYFKGLRYPLL